MPLRLATSEARDAQERPAPGGGAGTAASDADLLRRMSQGDETALGALYDRYASTVHALVMHLLRESGDAEDVVEEAFWQTWRQASRYETGRGTVSTWVLTIARSRALDRLRARRRMREEPMPELSPAVEADQSAVDPAEFTEAAERRVLVRSALDSLPAEQRETLELGYFGGLSQSEIAEKIGQPLGTVKTRMRLAMQKLRERLSVLRESPA